VERYSSALSILSKRMTKKDLSRPPRFKESFLKRVFPDEGIYTTIGDLEEVYHSIAEEKSIAKARLWYRMQASKSIISYLKNQFLWSLVMFKNYLVFTSRLIERDKFHYFLNFLGLSIGIACSIVIMMLLRNELTYDQYHEKADRIYRISSNYVTSGKPLLCAITSPALGPRLKEEYPEIDSISKKLKVIADLDYREVGHFILPDTSWTEPYYKPLEKRVEELEAVWAEIPVAKEVIQETRFEIEMFRKYHEFYGYCFFIMGTSHSKE